MSLQIEHKTEKGTVRFVKVNEKCWDFKINENGINYFEKFSNCSSLRTIPVTKGTVLIGLTREVTEKQAKMMVLEIDSLIGRVFKDYTEHGKFYKNPTESFKSLMQHLQVYEVNPYGGYRHDFTQTWQEAQSRTGKWIVLFKPND